MGTTVTSKDASQTLRRSTVGMKVTKQSDRTTIKLHLYTHPLRKASAKRDVRLVLRSSVEKNATRPRGERTTDASQAIPATKSLALAASHTL